MSNRPNVIVTGATGVIGRTLMEDLDGVFELTGTSRQAQDDPRFRVLDFDDIDAVAEAFAGQDAVVHMHAKSNHATRWYELVGERCDAESTPRPDGMYGVAKVWGEAVGRYYSDRFGLEVVCLRIGSYQYRRKPPEWDTGARILSTWLSDRDLVNLVRRSVEAPGIRWGIYYGISANARAYWDITNAVTELGYRPRDNAEDYADEVLAKGGEYDLWGYTTEGMV